MGPKKIEKKRYVRKWGWGGGGYYSLETINKGNICLFLLDTEQENIDPN